MKKITLFLAIVVFAACQKEVLSDEKAPIDIEAFQTRTIETSIFSDNPVSYLANTDFSLWTKVESLEERFSVCDISEDMVKAMTTDAIVRSVLHYPLNYIIFAYNNPIDAIKIVLEHSNLHQELLRRDDAAEILLLYFEKAEIDMTRISPYFDESYRTVSYSDEMFLEYLIASRMINGFDNPVVSKRLLDIADKKAKKRYMDTTTYSDYSLIPLNAIKNSAPYAQEQRYSTYIHTYFGQALGVESYSELSATEIGNITYQYASEYPEAEIIRPASRKYNCHSYAWYDQSTSNQYWLNSLASNNELQLQRYWTDDYYFVTTEANAEKVFYASGDHSAIPLSTTEYISKWGTAPLMKHSPTYCPYTWTNRHYYEHRTYLPYDITSSIVGDTFITVNTIHNYSLPHNYHGLSVIWSSEPLSGVPGTCQSTMNSDGSCSFSANTPGAYYLYLEGYRNGVQLIAGYLIIIVGML